MGIYIQVFLGGCGRLLHTLDSTVQCVLVSPVFGTVSSLHHTSDFYTSFFCTAQGLHCTLLSVQPSFYQGPHCNRDLEAAFFISGDTS